MTVSSEQAAKRLCERAGWTLSNLELQKQLYVAHMLHLGKTGKPLIHNHFEAWDYGPVEPSLYHKVKVFGAESIVDIFPLSGDIDDQRSEAEALDQASEMLEGASPGRLVAITHWEDGAWAKHYDPKRRRVIIPNKDIVEEFKDRIDAAQRRKQQRH